MMQSIPRLDSRRFPPLWEPAGITLEVALDFATQCSPNHPWLDEHPEWFRRRPDGSIKYAEDLKEIRGHRQSRLLWAQRLTLWTSWRDVVLFLVNRGVRIFRSIIRPPSPLPLQAG
jgi:starch synthase (maltosyl-transferring)